MTLRFDRLARAAALAAAMGLSAAAACAQVSVEQPWARATVASQKSSGVFMNLKATGDARLVGVSTPVAGVAEVHEMRMDGDVMRMRAIEALPLPAGQTVALKPGGYHVMLMDLKQPLKAGDRLPLTLRIVDAQGKQQDVALEVPIRAMGSAAAAPAHGADGAAAGGHGTHHKH